MDKAFIAPGLDFYINNPTMMLPFEAVNEIGLDGNGHDGNERFPYTWGNLTAAERTRLRTAAAHQDVVDDVEDDEYDEYDTVVYYPVADAAPDSQRRTRLIIAAVLMPLAWLFSAAMVLILMVMMHAQQVDDYPTAVIIYGLLAAAGATYAVKKVFL